MNHSILYFLNPIFIGIGATLTFDLWGLFLKYTFKVSPSNFCLVGRWLRYMQEGVFKHSSMGTMPKKSAECIVGWIAHYVIGIIFAMTFLAFAGNNWIQHPTLVSAFLFGMLTVSAPFFIMQPAFGMGIAASKAPNPKQVRFRSLMNHIVFGLGLYLFGLLAGWLYGYG